MSFFRAKDLIFVVVVVVNVHSSIYNIGFLSPLFLPSLVTVSLYFQFSWQNHFLLRCLDISVLKDSGDFLPAQV